MDKQEQIISKMDELLGEIRAGKAESAASIALQQRYIPKKRPFIKFIIL